MSENVNSVFILDSLQKAALATERLGAMGVDVLAVQIGKRNPLIKVNKHTVLKKVCNGIHHLYPTNNGVRREVRVGIFDHCQIEWESGERL